GLAFAMASLKPTEPALLRVISDWATLWYLPSKHVTRRWTTGKPTRPPCSIVPRTRSPPAGLSRRGLDTAPVCHGSATPVPLAAGLRLRGDGHGAPRLGWSDRLDTEVGAARAEHVAGRGVGELRHRRDAARRYRGHRLLLLAAHHGELVQALLVHRASVHERH